MNSDQVKGRTKDAIGKVQSKVGELVGSNKQRIKGVAKQVEGKEQKAVGDARESIEQRHRDSES